MIKKLKAYIYPNIASISIIVGIIGIVAHLITTYFRTHYFDLYREYIHYIDFLIIVQLPDFLSYFYKHNYYPESKLEPFTLLFMVMMIAGGIIFNKTGQKDARLLKFSYSVIFIHSFISLVTLPINYLYLLNLAKVNPIPDSIFSLDRWLWHLLYIIPIIIASYLFTKWLINDQIPVVEENIKNKEDPILNEASSGKRFMHLIFDILLMVFLFGRFLIFFDSPFNTSRNEIDNWVLSVFTVAGLSIYYLVLEGIFKATPLKFLTGTTVVNKDLTKELNFTKILARTISRQIPFDAVSFLGKRGWHDSISGTKVVVSAQNGKSGSYHILWGVIVLCIYLMPPLFSYIQEEIEAGREKTFITQAHESFRKSIVYHIDKGDVVIMSKDATSYNPSRNLILLYSIDTNSIKGQRFKVSSSNWINKDTLQNIDYTDSSIILVDTVSILKQDLFLSYNNDSSISLSTMDSSKYQVQSVYDLYAPQLSCKSSSKDKNDGDPLRSYYVTYDKLPIVVTNIKTIEGNASWQNNLPIPADYSPKYDMGYFYLNAKNIRDNQAFKAELELKYDNKRHFYIMEGRNSRIVIYKKI